MRRGRKSAIIMVILLSLHTSLFSKERIVKTLNYEPCSHIKSFSFVPDSLKTLVVYSKKTGGQDTVVIDGREYGTHDRIRDIHISADEAVYIGKEIKSSNGGSYLLSYIVDKKKFVLFNNRKLGPFREFASAGISPDGKRFAFHYWIEGDRLSYIRFHNKIYGPYLLMNLRFSDDCRHFIAIICKNKKPVLVLDGLERQVLSSDKTYSLYFNALNTPFVVGVGCRDIIISKFVDKGGS